MNKLIFANIVKCLSLEYAWEIFVLTVFNDKFFFDYVLGPNRTNFAYLIFSLPQTEKTNHLLEICHISVWNVKSACIIRQKYNTI